MSMITGLLSLKPAGMRRASLGLALFAGTAIFSLEPNAAQAQFWGGYGSSWWGGPPRPWSSPRYQDEGVLRPGEIADLLRRRSWTILSPPSMSGRHYVANVRNEFGQRLFVVLDAYDGRILDARQIEERPNTNELAAIPGGNPATRPDEIIRPGAQPPLPATPTPKSHHSPTQAKRTVAPALVKSTPLETPKEKEGTLAVSKPTAAPPAVKPVVPAPATPEANGSDAPKAPSATASPAQDGSQSVRQVYPSSGSGAAEPARAPQSAEASPSAPATPSPKPAPTAPTKPVLPADAGFE
jgi:hypothetical protein